MPTDADTRDFHEQLKAFLPRLRVYALSLTRDRDAADDLVHDTVVKALTGRASFEPGRSTDDKISAVQYIRFPLPSEAFAALQTSGTPIAMEIDHPNYRHRVACSDELRASLAADYA